MPLSVRKRSTIKSIAPDPGSCTRIIPAEAAAGPEFFLLVYGTVQARRHSRGTVRTPGRIFSHRDLPSMTDYRVHHLVTDLRSRLWASSHGSFSAWSQACSPIC